MIIANIVGARPQFVKYFAISKAIEAFKNSLDNSSFPTPFILKKDIKDILLHTGQHYDYMMSKVFFDEFGIKDPDYHLGIGSGTHGEQTGQVTQKVEKVLMEESPDIVLVYGDTNSTLGGALAAAKLHIPVAHVEAGLRSYNKSMPEEINRVLTDHMSSILFCPTESAIENLKEEGFKNIVNDGKLISENHDLFNQNPIFSPAVCISCPVVINVGDVMFDALQFSVEIADKKSWILEELGFSKKDYYLLTLHRAENTDNQANLKKIISFVNNLSSGTAVIFPMHPRTEKVYQKSEIKFQNNIRIIKPVSYFDMLILLKNSKILMTDSGGMQKEAFWLKVPCITLREETEWVETIESGWNVLYKNYKGLHNPLSKKEKYYGDGKAAGKIINIIIKTALRGEG